MPTAATPFEHAELPVATKWTGEPEVLPLPGEDTLTPANAGKAKMHRHTTTWNFTKLIPTSPVFWVKRLRRAQLNCRDSRCETISLQRKTYGERIRST